MTYNQTVYQGNLETKRHNEAYEAETAAHNRKMESIEQERNRIDDYYRRESIRVQDDLNEINRLKVEYDNTRDWAKIMGRNPGVATKVANASSVKTHKHIFRDDTYTGDWTVGIQEYIDSLLQESEDIKQRWDQEIANWTSGNSELFLEGERLISNYYTSSLELNQKQTEALQRFAATWSQIGLNKEHEEVLKRQSDMLEGQTSMMEEQTEMYRQQANYYREQANYQNWYNQVAPWQSVWGLVNQSAGAAGGILRGIGGIRWPSIGGKSNYDPADNFRNLFTPNGQTNVPNYAPKY